MTSKRLPSRRRFLGNVTKSTLGAGAVAAFPTIVPQFVFGQNAPSNQIVVGHVGLGWRGLQLMKETITNPNIRIAALADLDRSFLVNGQNILDEEAGVERVRVKDNRPVPPPKGAVDSYHDYRRLLDRKDIDALVIAVPDHWHAKTSIEAVEAGKDVYGEKPLSLTINEGRKMVRKTRENGRIYQVGSQQRSMGSFRKACEYIRSGRLGKVHRIDACIGGVGQIEGVPDEPVPPGLDWDFWLGQTPIVPFNVHRCHVDFRWFFEYSGGKMTDWGAHHLDIAQWALGADHTGPVRAKGTTKTEKGYFNVFNSFDIELTYASGAKVYAKSKGENGVTFYGEKGKIFASRSRVESTPAGILEEPLGSGDLNFYTGDNHMQNWAECVKSRELPVADIEIGHRSVTVCHIANICGRLGREIQWDPENELFVNDPEANSYMSREQREPYAI